MTMVEKAASLALGSLAGGFSRYFLAGVTHKVAGAAFPYGTLAVNLSGCFLIGLLDAITHERFALGPNARLLLMTGFCGAFTTFSTLILESSAHMRSGEHAHAWLNIGVSIVMGLVLFRAGESVGKLI